MRPDDQQQRVSICRRTSDYVGTDYAVGSASIVHNHRLTPYFRQLLGYQSADDVRSPPAAYGTTSVTVLEGYLAGGASAQARWPEMEFREITNAPEARIASALRRVLWTVENTVLTVIEFRLRKSCIGELCDWERRASALRPKEVRAPHPDYRSGCSHRTAQAVFCYSIPAPPSNKALSWHEKRAGSAWHAHVGIVGSALLVVVCMGPAAVVRAIAIPLPRWRQAAVGKDVAELRGLPVLELAAAGR